MNHSLFRCRLLYLNCSYCIYCNKACNEASNILCCHCKITFLKSIDRRYNSDMRVFDFFVMLKFVFGLRSMCDYQGRLSKMPLTNTLLNNSISPLFLTLTGRFCMAFFGLSFCFKLWSTFMGQNVNT